MAIPLILRFFVAVCALMFNRGAHRKPTTQGD